MQRRSERPPIHRPQVGAAGAITLAALVAVLVAGCIHTKPAKLVPDDPEFKGRIDTLAQAYETLDVEKILTYYTLDTYSLSFDLPYKFDTGVTEHRERLRRFLSRFDSIRVSPAPNLEVWRDEDRVWTIRAFKATGTMKNGDAFAFDGHYSAVWERRAERWGIVYEHFWGTPEILSPPAPTPTPQPVAETVPVAPPTPVGEVVLEDVFFDYDKWDIRPDQVPTLAANAQKLRENPGLKVLVEGHCDERGTRGYNFALGQRRAEAARAYLVGLGVEAERMQVISIGKERPFEQGRGEPFWGRNRRAHFVVTQK